MPPSVVPHLTTKRESLLLFTLAAVQFTLMMDFVIVMPLGSHLMRAFGISPAQFGLLIAIYGIAAGITGFMGGFVLDRFDRRTALLTVYLGFALATLACAVAPTYHILLLARFVAGAFGGVSGSLITAMVGDAIPPERRGRAMGRVMVAIPLCSIIGVPSGLVLASLWGWHSTYYLLSTLCFVIVFGAFKILPHVASHQTDAHPVRQMWNILNHRIHLRAFLLRACLVFSGASILPFMAPSLVFNVGLNEQTQMPLVYMIAGLCTFFTIPWFGRLSDRYDKVNVLIGVAALGIPAILIITRLGPAPLYQTYFFTTLFFICMSGRFTPIMALITNSVESKYRGGFMSLNSAVQFTTGSIANVVGGLFVTMGADGHLHGYAKAGWISSSAFVVTILVAAWLRSAAPHAARNPTPIPVVGPRFN